MATTQYFVRSGHSIVANLDKDGRKKQRFDGPRAVDLDPAYNNTEYLEAIGAITTSEDEANKPLSTREAIRRNNAYRRGDTAKQVDTGQIQESGRVAADDDGGEGSDPTPGVEGGNPGDPEPPTPEPGSTKSSSKTK